MVTQHILNAGQAWILYALIACGFYLVTTTCRHFNFGAAVPFILMPHLVAMRQIPPPLATMCGFLCCAAIGIAWRRLSGYMIRRGSTESQLLLFSLAILGIAENSVRLVFGNESLSLWNYEPRYLVDSRWFLIGWQQVILLGGGGGLLIVVLIIWRVSLLGTSTRALAESRLGLLLRGYNVPLLEDIGAGAGFSLIGIVGILWAINTRVRPGLGLEIGVIGIVTYIVGYRVLPGLTGVVVAAFALAALKVPIALRFEGDWSMIATLLLLILSVAGTTLTSVHRSSKT